jgi:cysteine desulfurase
MAANNEIGTLAPLKKVSEITQEAGVLLHSDGAQLVGKLPIHPKELGVDLLSLSAHKLYGPKGVGALYVAQGRPSHSLKPILWGGGHQGGLRSGTLNVPGIVGLGRAAQLAQQEMEAEAKRQAGLRDQLWQGMQAKIPEIWVNGDLERRLPGNLNVGFAGVASDKLLMAVKDIALSAGSACTSDRPEPSHVLKALGLSDEAVHASIRMGLGRNTRAAEIPIVVERLSQAVAEIRSQEGIDF